MYKMDFSKKEYDHLVEVCGFTDDELEVLDLKRRGWYTADIAAELNISERTVKRRTQRIVNKIIRTI